MANTDPEVLQAAQLAYERSNASLKDYDPRSLADEAKVRDVNLNRPHPLEPVLTRAEDSSLVAAAEAVVEAAKADAAKTAK